MAEKGMEASGTTPFDDLWDEIGKLQKKVAHLQNNRQPTMPLYNFHSGAPGDLPDDAVEGQVGLGVDDSAWQYTNGAWHKIGGFTYCFAWYDTPTILTPSTLQFIDFNGSIYTNASSGVFSIDEWTFVGSPIGAVGHFGLGIHAPGLYWIHIGVELVDAWGGGDPSAYQLYIEDVGTTFQLSAPSFGSYVGKGFHPFHGDGTLDTSNVIFDASYSVLMAIEETGNAPILIQSIQNSPYNLTAYPNILAIAMDGPGSSFYQSFFP